MFKGRILTLVGCMSICVSTLLYGGSQATISLSFTVPATQEVAVEQTEITVQHDQSELNFGDIHLHSNLKHQDDVAVESKRGQSYKVHTQQSDDFRSRRVYLAFDDQSERLDDVVFLTVSDT